MRARGQVNMLVMINFHDAQCNEYAHFVVATYSTAAFAKMPGYGTATVTIGGSRRENGKLSVIVWSLSSLVFDRAQRKLGFIRGVYRLEVRTVLEERSFTIRGHVAATSHER